MDFKNLKLILDYNDSIINDIKTYGIIKDQLYMTSRMGTRDRLIFMLSIVCGDMNLDSLLNLTYDDVYTSKGQVRDYIIGRNSAANKTKFSTFWIRNMLTSYRYFLDDIRMKQECSNYISARNSKSIKIINHRKYSRYGLWLFPSGQNFFKSISKKDYIDILGKIEKLLQIELDEDTSKYIGAYIMYTGTWYDVINNSGSQITNRRRIDMAAIYMGINSPNEWGLTWNDYYEYIQTITAFN